MSSEALDGLKDEILRHRAELAPQLEGFEDLADVNVGPETKSQVLSDIEGAKRRDALSIAAVEALSALAADGYPDLKIIQVHEDIYQDLAEQKRTIDAALLRYAPLPPEAVGGSVTVEE